MLVLTRKVGEEIVFPGLEMRLRILSIKGKRAKIGIIAPDDVAVARDELVPENQEPDGSTTPPKHVQRRNNRRS